METQSYRRKLGVLDQLCLQSSPAVLSKLSTGPPCMVLVHQHSSREVDLHLQTLLPAGISLGLDQNYQLSFSNMLLIMSLWPLTNWVSAKHPGRTVYTFMSHSEAHTRVSVWKVKSIPSSSLITKLWSNLPSLGEPSMSAQSQLQPSWSSPYQ